MSLTQSSLPLYKKDKKSVDLIIHGRYLVTMDYDNPVIEEGAVAILDGVIIAVDKAQNIAKYYTAKKKIMGKDRILMPGLINGHTHAAMVLFRGMIDDLPLLTWLQDYIFPAEGKFVDLEFIEVGMKLACLEMIKGGTTSFVDMYFHAPHAASIVEASGLRAIIGSASIDMESPGYTGWDDSFAGAMDFVKKGTSNSGRITKAFAPHSTYTVSPDHLKKISDMARTLNVPMTMHLSEDLGEISLIKERYGTTPILHAYHAGLLDHRFIAAHVTHPMDSEIDLLARYKVGVIHNPTSNLKTGSGISPVPKMLARGVLMGLGTDGAASNNGLNMWQEIRLAALIHKGVEQDATVMKAETVLHMATRGGAEAVGLGDRVGDIAVGKKADLIQIDLTGPHMTPLYDVISHLVYAVNSSDVVTTIVDGHILMEDRKVLTLDPEDIRAQANVIASRIKIALNNKKSSP